MQSVGPVFDVEDAGGADEDGDAREDGLHDDGEAGGVKDAQVAVLRPHDEAARRVLLLALLVEGLHGRDGRGQRRHLVLCFKEELDALRGVVDGEIIDGLVRHEDAPVPQSAEAFVCHQCVHLSVIEALPQRQDSAWEHADGGWHALNTCHMETSSSSSFGPGSVNL
jgi:hypothetical protein